MLQYICRFLRLNCLHSRADAQILKPAVFVIFDLRREAESNLSFANSVIGLRRRLRTSDDNDIEHVINTESSLETDPFATFRPPPTFYNLFKLFFYIT